MEIGHVKTIRTPYPVIDIVYKQPIIEKTACQDGYDTILRHDLLKIKYKAWKSAKNILCLH